MPSALLINGTVGSGKTSVADAAGDLLAAAGVPNAVIDLDWLRRAWPSPPHDRFNTGLTLRNLRAVAGNYLEAGSERLVLAGVVESRQERAGYLAALGVDDLTVCRLRVDLGEVRRRLTRRHELDEQGLRWHLDRSGELEAILEQARTEDFTLDATGLMAPEAAEQALRLTGWLPPAQ
ncbi:hypothetical protein [Nonomuraea dietziae]|uniref:Adenylylsulfate kinase-like enzyme n=1 Tax=Nonomuraea dietziae TaxID=65515 RepID=A0A7W5YQC5_9ACTN|nr:hypothetical protein [Nonomuraea dietziae]MBB3726189.1 adenylylsulfate kinase-like enzyme [Nonomuraea dietziae]